MVIREHDSNWHLIPPLEAGSRVGFPSRGPNRSIAFLLWHSSVPASRSVPVLFVCNPPALLGHQTPCHRLRWNSTVGHLSGRFESTPGSPWRVSWRWSALPEPPDGALFPPARRAGLQRSFLFRWPRLLALKPLPPGNGSRE